MPSAVALLAADCTVVELTIASLYPASSTRALDLERWARVDLAAASPHIQPCLPPGHTSPSHARPRHDQYMAAPHQKKKILVQSSTSPTSCLGTTVVYHTTQSTIIVFHCFLVDGDDVGLIYGAR